MADRTPGENGDCVKPVIDQLLATLGIRPDLPAILDQVEKTLAELGHRATIISLRHGNLTVDCDPRTASMLAWDEDILTEQVNRHHHDAIATVTITVAGGRGRTAKRPARRAPGR
jgi:hypothetical protein